MITFSGRGAEYAEGPRGFTSRIAYAAAPVVADPRAENIPGASAALDWDATLRFRRHLWSYGFGVAEAMDTAQRGAGLDYAATRELIRRTAEAAAGPAGRSPRHLLELMRLADGAGLLPDAELATHRARAWLATVGLS
jgi:hypothetical protein